jgi:hypothetical protein
MALTIQGICIPDGKLARETIELVRDRESPLLFHRSSRCLSALVRWTANLHFIALCIGPMLRCSIGIRLHTPS